MLKQTFFNTVFAIPILNLLVILYQLFSFIKIPGAFGFAIIGLTTLVRLVLHPFFKQQIETARKMQDLKPHLDKLSQKHKSEPKKLQEEQMRLYQQAGINPASGCLFMVIQIPVFIALYNTLNLFLANGNTQKVLVEINKVLYHPILKVTSIDPWFFGFNLALAPSKANLWYYYLIPVITAVLQYLQASVTTPQTVDTSKKEGSSEDFQKAFGTQMKYFFPLMIGWFSYNLPVGLALYWNIFSLFSIIQYRKVNKPSLVVKNS